MKNPLIARCCAAWHGICRKFSRMTIYLLLLALAFVFLYPFLYMIVTSLMSNEDLNNFTVAWIPRSLHISNYSLAAKLMNLGLGLKNSIIVTVLATLGQLISCSMAGYGLARYRFPGKKIVFFLIILAMIVPAQTIIVPQYLMYAKFGWLNTYLPLIVPSLFGFGFKGALYIYIFRQFYLGLPKELEAAARVDGCGFLRTYVRIILPTARTAHVVVLVLALVWNWSNYFEPSMYLSKSNMYTLSMSLNNITDALSLSADTLSTVYSVNDGSMLNNAVLMAGAILVILPVGVVFAFLQKKFVQGIERTGLTGE